MEGGAIDEDGAPRSKYLGPVCLS
uniref:Uncharacterized protein n=1 Tax=Arundo donax TaxID=35708 RepID=A0A0A8ZGK8_ARUDO